MKKERQRKTSRYYQWHPSQLEIWSFHFKSINLQQAKEWFWILDSNRYLLKFLRATRFDSAFCKKNVIISQRAHVSSASALMWPSAFWTQLTPRLSHSGTAFPYCTPHVQCRCSNHRPNCWEHSWQMNYLNKYKFLFYFSMIIGFIIAIMIK